MNPQVPSTSLPGSRTPLTHDPSSSPLHPSQSHPGPSNTHWCAHLLLQAGQPHPDTHLTPCSGSDHLTTRRLRTLLLPPSSDLASNAPVQWPPRCPHLSLRVPLAPSRALGQVWTEPRGAEVCGDGESQPSVQLGNRSASPALARGHRASFRSRHLNSPEHMAGEGPSVHPAPHAGRCGSTYVLS